MYNIDNIFMRCGHFRRLPALAAACLLTVSVLRAQTMGAAHRADSLKAVIDDKGGDLAALEAYIELSGPLNDTVVAQFKDWMKQFPQSPDIPFALGEAYYKRRDRSAITYLIRSGQLQKGRNERLSKMIGVARDEKWDLDIPRMPGTVDSLKRVVESMPDSALPVNQYLFVMGSGNDTAIAQVDAWMKAYPHSAAIPLALGEAYYDEESPKAKPYLLKVVELQPGNARVWQMLSIDAERWGDNDGARAYMGKAAAAAPDDPSYSFYYAMDFEHVDPARWRSSLYDLAKRFPQSERGAQGLYWLAVRTKDPAEKIRVFEQLRTLYPPAKFSWSEGGMSGLYDAYLLEDQSQKAVELARSMGSGSGWPDKAVLAENVVKVQGLVKDKRYKEAYALLDKLKAPRYSSAVNDVALLRSRVIEASGDTPGAYDSLAILQARSPSDEVRAAMLVYGKNLGKTDKEVDKDIWALRDKATRMAPDFNLGLYTSDGKLSLRDLRGKVVLLTFWFPGCGPCRGEFPHFENVVRKFKGKKVVYIGINVFPQQDDYVLPFMQGTGYSFIPLRGTSEWAQQTYKVRGEPTNFLIDGDGRIVFADFRIDGNNERMLELMIGQMLARNGGVAKASLPAERLINNSNNN